MSRVSAVLVPIVLAALSACDRAPTPEVAPPVNSPAPESEASPVEAPPAEILETPFTAEEIRGEWTEGFTLEVQMSSPAGVELQRWTVVGADAEGVDIEYATLDPTGGVVGRPRVQRAAWIELRDHASFPSASATRQETVRSTVLGDLDGWLYTVRDDAAGTVSELFFARSLPGAPVEMTVSKDGEELSAMAQIGRRRPE